MAGVVAWPLSGISSLRCGPQIFGRFASAASSHRSASSFSRQSSRRKQAHPLSHSPFAVARTHSTRPPNDTSSSQPPESSHGYSQESSHKGGSDNATVKTSTPTLKSSLSDSTVSRHHGTTIEEHRSSDPSVPNPSSEYELPSLSESRRDRISAAIQNSMDNAQRKATEASNWASNATGTSYRAIDRLKNQNAELETHLAKSREELDTARKEYQSVVQRRLQTQREVNTLLARKDGWTAQDLERFTSLYRDDHTLDASVSAASATLANVERETEKLRDRLIAGILGRYHEEQIWSDRIRRLSTWGTWGLMGVNVLLFLLFQFGAEPWRRARLVRGFEEKVAEGVHKVLLEERERVSGAAGVSVGVSGKTTVPPLVGVATVKEEPVVLELGLETPSVQSSVGSLGSAPAEVEVGKEMLVVAARQVPAEEAISENWKDAWVRRKEFLSSPDRWKAAVVDLASDRVVWLRMRDASLLVVEGAAAGVFLTGAMMAMVVWGKR